MVVVEADTALRSLSGAERGEAGRTMGVAGDATPKAGAVDTTLGDRAALALEAYRMGVAGPVTDLVREVTPLLWHVVRAQNVPRETAEDVVQGVWLAFVRNADKIREPQGVLQWLVVTARRAAWEATRKHRDHERRTAPLPEGESAGTWDLVSAEPQPEESVLTDERDQALWRAYGALSERCRQLLRVLAFADRPTYRLISEVTGINETSVGTIRGRCLAQLRAELETDEGWGRR